MAVFWVVAACSLVEVYQHTRGLLIARMMEAARASETLVNFYQTTRRYNPEDSCQVQQCLQEVLDLNVSRVIGCPTSGLLLF
jgi:hypothetical protein